MTDSTRPQLFLASGHTTAVTAVAMCSDGRLLASAEQEGTLLLWDTAQAAVLRWLRCEDNPNWGLSFSPGDEWILAGERSGCRVWSCVTGEECAYVERTWGPRSFLGPRHFLTCIGGEIVEISLPDGRATPVTSLRKFAERLVPVVAFSSDGVLAAELYSEPSYEVLVWEIASGKAILRFRLPGRTGRVYSAEERKAAQFWIPPPPATRFLAYTEDRRALWVGCTRGLWLCDLQSGERCLFTPGQFDRIDQFARGAGERMAAVQPTHATDHTQQIQFWSSPEALRRPFIDSERRWFWSLAFSGDGRYLAAGTFDSGVGYFPTDAPGEWRWMPGHRVGVGSATYSPQGNTIAATYRDGTVRLWNAESGVLRETLTGAYEDVGPIAFSPDGNVLAIASAASGSTRSWPCDSAVELVDLRTHQRRCVISTNRGWPHRLAFCPRRRLLAASWYSNFIDETWVVDWHTGVDVYRVPGGMATFSPDGKLLAVATGDPLVIQLHHAGTGEPLATLTPTYRWDGIASMVFSPDSRDLLAGSGLGNPACWNVETHECLWEAAVGDRSTCGESVSTAYSPDGARLALVAEFDSEVWVWSMPDRTPLATLEGHTGGVHFVDVSPDGSQIVSGGTDGTIKIWDMYKLELSATLVLLPANPEFPSQEWVTYTPEGYYAGSPGADRFIRWECNGELLPAGAFSAQFRSPDRVAKKLGGE